jgi:hypothetical protein
MTVPMIEFRTIFQVLVLLALVISTPVFGEQNADQPGNEQTPDATESSENTTSPAEEEDPGKFRTWWNARKAKQDADPNRGRFLPIPIFITEPAIGDGLGLALTYFHRKREESARSPVASLESIGGVSKEQEAPPTATAVFGAYTSNETAAAGVGHMNSFKDDHIRFSGALAYANVNSTFYILDRPFKFNLKGYFAYQDTRFRFGDSRWFWGIGLSYLDASSAFRVDLPDETPINLFPNDLTNAGLAAKLAWDSRDNTSMPNNGQLFDLSLWRYDDAIGGDYNYWDSRLKLLSFHQLSEKFVLGLRAEYTTINGAAPFFAVPYVKLRGIAALRYQGDRVAVAEIEGRYNFSSRWAMIGFTGAGKVNSDVPVIDTEQSIYNYGLGARYKIFDAQNIWLGIDIAKGPEDYNWYIQVGQAW